MPNIQVFDAPDLAIRPTETGVEATAAAARRGGAFYNSAGEAMNAVAASQEQTGRVLGSAIEGAGPAYKSIHDFVEKTDGHREVSHGALVGTQMADGIDQSWNLLVKGGKDADGNVIPPADPNDESVRAKFLEQTVEPALDKFRNGFSTETGQQFADEMANRIRQHIFTKSAADMSTLAGVATKSNAIQTINTLANTVRNDPSSLDFALSTVDHAVGAIAGSSPTLTPETAAKVQAEISSDGKAALVKTYLYSVGEKNPAELERVIQSGKYAQYLDPTDTQRITDYAKGSARINDAEARRQTAQQQHDQDQAFGATMNDLELSTLPKTTGEQPTLPDDYYDRLRKAAEMPGAQRDPARFKAMAENGERITSRLGKPEPLAPISHASTIDLLNRIRASDDTRLQNTDAIYKAYGDGKLNNSDFSFLMKEWTDQRSPEGARLSQAKADFFKGVAPMIENQVFDPTQGGDDRKLRMYSFQRDVENNVAQYIRDKKNPYDLLDPSKPDYMGRPEILNQPKYRTSLQQQLSGSAGGSVNLTGPGKAITGVQVTDAPIPQRQAGETLDAWMKRTGRGFGPPAAAMAPAVPRSQ